MVDHRLGLLFATLRKKSGCLVLPLCGKDLSTKDHFHFFFSRLAARDAPFDVSLQQLETILFLFRFFDAS